MQGLGGAGQAVKIQVAALAPKSTLDQSLMSVPRGGHVDRTVSVHSVAGPDTAVTYTLHDGPESAGLFMDPATIWLAAGQTAQAMLRFHAAPEAGHHQMWLTAPAASL